ncbi:MAG: nitrate ABC transporter ATP-binding protein [Puniceicoccaceae bacterium]|nr:MAG: nitrate ABC transporter ATP-binding protein [Puniceicoccaceae bacterium]
MLKNGPPSFSRRHPLRLGLLALNDAAPLLVAKELGLFQRHGLDVELHRQPGWATIRDKIIFGELDAAHAPAAMVPAVRLGLGCLPTECLTALVLNLHGNAITLSMNLFERGVRDAASLAREFHSAAIRRKPTFGVVFRYSSHYVLLREWLRSGGLDPDREVNLVVVPPAQLFPNLAAGNIDGYCVGEPWNSLAIRRRAGWSPAVSAELAPGHPEKVLLVREDWAREHEEEHAALIRALLEACEFCDRERGEVVSLLARSPWLNLPASILAAGLCGPFLHRPGHSGEIPNFVVFHRFDANRPCPQKADFVLHQLEQSGLARTCLPFPPRLAGDSFRTDLFDAARLGAEPAATTAS